MSTDSLTFVKYGLGVALGLFVMLYTFESYHWYGYMKANPNTGSVSGGGWWFNGLFFIIGVVVAFTSFMSGLQQAIQSDI
ncbi:hypothetical protein ACFPYI_04410 [Halomarina salina]|uniref:Uncharacterized protein n=1 Tax=Halomarina salina TaxID=1872699 RepID=A0ABD5RJ23_9EURY|nr:hypothetical protein [Halomarina salina]